MTTTATPTIARPPVRREYNRDRPKVPHTTHLRELEMPDGRKLLVDRRALAFVCEAKSSDFDGKQVSIVGFRTVAKPIPVQAPFADLKRWWFGDAGASNGKAA